MVSMSLPHLRVRLPSIRGKHPKLFMTCCYRGRSQGISKATCKSPQQGILDDGGNVWHLHSRAARTAWHSLCGDPLASRPSAHLSAAGAVVMGVHRAARVDVDRDLP